MLKSLTLASLMVLGTVGLAHAEMDGMGRHHGFHRCTGTQAECDKMRAEHKAKFEQRLKSDPEFAKKVADRKAKFDERMKNDPAFAKKVEERKAMREKMKNDPDFAKKIHAERKAKFDAKMKNDPDFAKKMQERKIQWDAQHKAKTAPVSGTTN